MKEHDDELGVSSAPRSQNRPGYHPKSQRLLREAQTKTAYLGATFIRKLRTPSYLPLHPKNYVLTVPSQHLFAPASIHLVAPNLRLPQHWLPPQVLVPPESTWKGRWGTHRMHPAERPRARQPVQRPTVDRGSAWHEWLATRRGELGGFLFRPHLRARRVWFSLTHCAAPPREDHRHYHKHFPEKFIGEVKHRARYCDWNFHHCRMEMATPTASHRCEPAMGWRWSHWTFLLWGPGARPAMGWRDLDAPLWESCVD